MWARLPDPDETESGDFSFWFEVVAARSDGSPHFWIPIWSANLEPILDPNLDPILGGGLEGLFFWARCRFVQNPGGPEGLF